VERVRLVAGGRYRYPAAMSKAFTRESDDLPEQPVVLRPPPSLPPGAKNYLTPDGAERFRAELERLVEKERPEAAAMPDADEARRSIQRLDQRIQHLQQCLASAEIVRAPSGLTKQVRFGAFVTVRERSENQIQYRIVGIDETDIDRGWVSWRSPVAKALLNAQVGDHVRLRLPAGEEELEILAINYG
jgi:transcription elongation factor GreB